MKADIKSLQEVVVIGYGAVNKSDLTGSYFVCLVRRDHAGESHFQRGTRFQGQQQVFRFRSGQVTTR